MTDGDERFERVLGERIRAYAADADRPIDPASVTARVRAGEGAARGSGGWLPGNGRGSWRAALAGFAAFAIVAVGVGVAIGALSSRAVGPGPSAPPSAVVSAPPSSTEPSVEPSASAAPSGSLSSLPASVAPSPSDSVAPSAPVVPSATLAPSASPTETPVPTDSTPPSPTASTGGVPAGFSPRSVTFVSPDEGFVLGGVACPSGSCAAIVHTLDAGRTWSAIGAPATTIVTDPADGATSGIAFLRFADPKDGWAFAPDLWATHDGGATWSRIEAPAIAGPVLALETARGTTHAVLADGRGAFTIVTSSIGDDGWTATGVTLPVGAGPVPELQLVLSGDAGWVLQNDRTVVNGARLQGGTWRPWTPVCADVVGPAYLAASSATDLVAACDVGLWGTPKGGRLFVSTNGGTRATETGTKIPVALGGAIASGRATTVVVSGTTADGAHLEATFDGGRTWTTVLDLGERQAVDLGFTTATQGVVVATAADGASQLFLTRDGGKTWQPVTF